MVDLGFSKTKVSFFLRREKSGVPAVIMETIAHKLNLIIILMH